MSDDKVLFLSSCVFFLLSSFLPQFHMQLYVLEEEWETVGVLCNSTMGSKFFKKCQKQIITFHGLFSLKTSSLNYRESHFSISSNQVTKEEPKSGNHLSKFDWHDLSLIFLASMLLHNLKVLQKLIQCNPDLVTSYLVTNPDLVTILQKTIFLVHKDTSFSDNLVFFAPSIQ